MGSICYDFLSNSFLFSDVYLNSEFKEVSEDLIFEELTKYRNYVLSNENEIVKDIKQLQSSLKVFSTIEHIPESTLLQSALYIEQFIIDDPLFKITHQSGDQSNTMGKYLGYQNKGLDKKTLVKTLGKLKRITPMIAADYIKLLPVSVLFEPKKNTPIYYSPNFFEDDLPKAIHLFCKQNAVVRSMEKLNTGGWRLLQSNDYTPGIQVGFGDNSLNNGMIYHYLEQEYTATDKSNVWQTRMNLAEYPMQPDIWSAWVNQSINRTAINLVDRVSCEISIATKLASTYITDDTFTSNLICQNFETITTPETVTTNQILNLELPFIDNINVQNLMDVRRNEQDTFTNFRIELEREFRELRSVTDEKELKERQENILHELAVVGVKKIDTKFCVH